jgi:hypothetical protein
MIYSNDYKKNSLQLLLFKNSLVFVIFADSD